jgi:alpha-2-macroglobulin
MILNCIIPENYLMPRVAICFLIFYLFLCFNTSGQSIVDPAAWKTIDSAIRAKKNLDDVKNQVLGIKAKAMAGHNDAALARCFVDLMMIQDQKTEDSLFFSNAVFMDSILNSSSSSALLKSIMHLLLARRISEFENKFYYRRNKNLIRTGSPGKEYAIMEKTELDSLVTDHIDTSLSISKRLNQINLNELLWLSSDPLIFLFRPDYTDLLFGERIFLFHNRLGKHAEKSAAEWLSESQDAFIKNEDQIKTFNKNEQTLFRYFHEWILYNLPNKREAAYFIETIARKYLYQNLIEDSINQQAYEKYLNDLLISPYNSVSVHAVYQLCKIWFVEAAKYNPTLGNHITRYGRTTVTAFDSSYRLYYDKTLRLLSRFETRLDSFSYIKIGLLNMRASILKPGLIIMTQDVQIPDSAFPAMLQYRNISHLYTRIIRINPWDHISQNTSMNISRFIKMPAIAEKAQSLILPDDHQWHNSFVRWNPLSAGRYIILYSDTIISNDTERINFIDISVTNLAVINNDQRVFVLNRITGFPVKGATVIVIPKQDQPSKANFSPNLKSLIKKVNDQGYVVLQDLDIDRINVYFGGDSIMTSVNKPEDNIPIVLYNKDSDDGLAEYYEDNIRLNIFTDRSIYRPGQTVFFKGIFTVPNPKTGELMVLDLQKLQFPFFENLVYKIVMKFKKLKTDVTISDPFHRTVDTLHVTPNRFGSFSGTYAISKDAATGEWEFDSKDYEMENQNSGTFHVEEYKRPSFKLVLTKPKTELQLGDSFNVQIKVRSFAGAPLANVRLQYHVSRYLSGIGDEEILKGESFSNELGESKIVVQDSSFDLRTIPEDVKTSAQYTVNVEALDETGESHEQDLNINLSNRPVNINMPIPDVVERNGITPVFISMTNEFSGPVKKVLDICIYKVSGDGQADNEKRWPPPDVWNENQDKWEKIFPDIKYDGFSKQEPIKKLIYKTSISAEADKKFTLPADLLATGFYKIEAKCEAGVKVLGETSKDFSVYDQKENSFPGREFELMPVNSAFTGDTLKLISGHKDKKYFSVYHVAYRSQAKSGISFKYDYIIRTDKNGLNEMDYKVPAGIIGDLTLTHIYILDNRIYRYEHRVQILNKRSLDPDIIIEKYRTQISPGEKEIFVVSIKTKNSQEAVELMTTMYDASLDELEPHKWEIPRQNIYYNSGSNWNRNITYLQINNWYESESGVVPFQKNGKPVWWISSPDILPSYFINQFGQSGYMYIDGSQLLQGQVSGVDIYNYKSNDVVAVGYGVAKRDLTGAVTTVRIRGINSLNGYEQPMIILDGVLFTGDIGKIKPETIVQGIILKGTDATALYGSRAADGVLILSTHGPVILPTPSEMPMPPLVIRKNFSESAFFYPTIYAGNDGMYSISFTLPESVTEWKWKLFAHTKKAGFAYLEKSLVSQLPLMVQPSMPRFLYQGDKIVLKVRITNLDTTDLYGQLKCTIEDLVTGENLNSSLLKESNQLFTVKHGSNTVGSFMLSIPTGFLHPLRIRTSAATNRFSDGEEHIIPILSRKFLVTQSVPVKSEIDHTAIVATSAFPGDAEPYGLSLYIDPKPQATLMNALTYLAFDPYGCSEQTINKMLAFSTAIGIARADSFLRQGISKIPNAENTGNKGNNEPEPDEQTMPWLQLQNASMIQQQKLKQLFDTAKSEIAFEKYLTGLMAMQNTDGGLSWFKGGKTDNIISGYVLAGLGKMHQDKLLNENFIKSGDGYPEFLSRLIAYIDNELTTPIKENNQIDFLYARSYWLMDHPLSPSVRAAADSVIKVHWNSINTYSVDQQATLIIISLRFDREGNSYRDRSLRQLESIRQLAISDSSNGVRWKAFSNSDDLDRQDEEAVARIAEAFGSSGKSGDIITGIVKWLLKTRNEHTWTTTKSTAAIIGLLQTPELPGVPHQLTAKVEDSVLAVTDNLFSGRTADFLNLSGKNFPTQISFNTTSSTSVSGSIKYYYFTSIPPVDSSNATVQIHKTLYRYDVSSGKWEPIIDSTALKISDKIKTVLTIKTARQLNYVFISERRAGAMEPRELESGYKYEDGLGYYQSVKDAGYLFFVDKIPSGIHTISYETVISASGNFTDGPASLQCMYRPSINTYSNICNVVVNP